jgi:hypothetical protein
MTHEVTPLAVEVLARVQRVYAAARDPARAVQMAAYMRHQFPFLGIPAPAQRALARQVLATDGAARRPAEADLRDVALGCWALPEREYQYFACDWLRRHAQVCSAGFIEVARRLVVTKPWWDTVDVLAAHLVGPLVARHPQLLSTMDAWSTGDDPAPAEVQGVDRCRPAVPVLHKPVRPSGFLHPKGDRLGATGVRQNGPGCGLCVCAGAPRSPVRSLRARGFEEPRLARPDSSLPPHVRCAAGIPSSSLSGRVCGVRGSALPTWGVSAGVGVVPVTPSTASTVGASEAAT